MNRKFYNAMTTNDALTENLMPTHSTSGNSVVDLFFQMGGMRGKSQNIIPTLIRSLSENKLLTIKAMFYNRDIRGGQGERETFRVMFKFLVKYYPDIAQNLLIHIPFYGRWDDVLEVTYGTVLEVYGFDLILYALKSGDKLCAKWMPRLGSKNHDKAEKLALYIFARNREMISPERRRYCFMSYRKLLSGNTEVVENLMCDNRWGEIKYDHVPSVAFSKYKKAFARHDGERFKEFITKVISGEKKAHAGAIFPHQVIKELLEWTFRHNGRFTYLYGRKEFELPSEELINATEAQWKNLPDFVENGDFYFLPICDVSGSMNGEPMEVSVALGIYLAERNKGCFKDLFVTFSRKPAFIDIKGNNIFEKLIPFLKINLAENTDLEATFRLILNQAVKNNLPKEYMPKILIIISDMQFDYCVDNYNDNSLQMIERMYRQAGYERPQIVYWNVRTSSGIPVKFDEHKTALVSGFSPSIIKQVLSGDLVPLNLVLKTLNSERYERISL